MARAPLLQAGGLADIERVALGIEHAVDPGARRQVLELGRDQRHARLDRAGMSAPPLAFGFVCARRAGLLDRLFRLVPLHHAATILLSLLARQSSHKPRPGPGEPDSAVSRGYPRFLWITLCGTRPAFWRNPAILADSGHCPLFGQFCERFEEAE